MAQKNYSNTSGLDEQGNQLDTENPTASGIINICKIRTKKGYR
jgi:hypothetical protein